MQGIEEKRQIASSLLISHFCKEGREKFQKFSMKNIWGADGPKAESSYEQEHTGISFRQLQYGYSGAL